MQGSVKLAGSQSWIARFSQWGYPNQFYLVVGLAELSGAIILLFPKLARFGALILIAVMIGATATHMIHQERQVVTTLVLLALLGAVLYLRRGTIAKAPAASR
jgi:putative oxidoreductase